MATLPVLSLRERFDALTPRERRMLGLLALALAAFLIYLLFRGGGGDEQIGLPDSPAPIPMAAPPPPPAAMAPPPSVPAAPVATAYRLIGIFGGGPGGGAAVLAMPDGSQRTVRIGREFEPGTRLRAVSLRHAILTTPSGDIMLEIGKQGGAPVPASSPAAAPAASAPAPAPSPPPDRARETMQYRLGLEPRRSGDRISGFVVKPGAQLPALQQAGLMPGDVLLAVNGRTFDSAERVEELAGEIASSYTAEFEVERAGRRQTFALQVRPRQSR